MATLRQTRRNLWGVVAGSWATAAGVLAWSVLSPVEDPGPVDATVKSAKRSASGSKGTVAAAETIDPKSVAWSRKWRQPLFDPPPKPAPAAAAAPAAPPFKVKLLGTLAGGARPSAILQVEGREAEVRETGEALVGRPDATVLSIESKRVTLTYADQELSLTVEEPKTIPLRSGP